MNHRRWRDLSLSTVRHALVRWRCSLSRRLAPGRTMAVFLPMKGHLQYVEGTLKELRMRGVRVHCLTQPEHIAYFKQVLGTGDVLPYVAGPRIPYRVLLTPATHLRADKYRHPATRVVHLPHSMVSLHTIFPPGTFIHFDTVLCCGPHHLQEIQAIFRHNGQHGRAVGTGYEVIDRLALRAPRMRPAGARPCVLVAPTWGESSLLYRFGRELVDRLLVRFDVILRPHRWRMEEIADLLDGLRRDHTHHPGFRFDVDIDAGPAMDGADVILSDASGVAFEFALGCLRPAVFIDGPRKNAHLEWRSILDQEGVEVRSRTSIGVIAAGIDELEATIERLLADPDGWSRKLTAARTELLCNFGRTAELNAAEIMKNLARERTRATNPGPA